MKFERITTVSLPFDRRHDDPKKNYGIGGLQIWFILKGSKGATQFMVGFDIYLPHLYSEYLGKFGPDSLKPKISGWDVGYHARKPQFEGHSPMEGCDLFNGEPCYYDGSSLLADDWVKDIFSIRGEDPAKEIWNRLEQEYIQRFGDQEDGTALREEK